MGSGESMFLFRDAKGATAAVAEGVREASPPEVTSPGVSAKTEVVLAPREDGTMRLDKMFIQGDIGGYQFINKK